MIDLELVTKLTPVVEVLEKDPVPGIEYDLGAALKASMTDAGADDLVVNFTERLKIKVRSPSHRLRMSWC